MSEETNVITADLVVEDNIAKYGVYTHSTKITNVVDGLKPINRRVLLVQNSTTFRKVVAITGGVMEKYHPHGDMSIADAIVRMAQPFSTFITLMHADSNYGDYGGATQAQPRYLEIGASQFAMDMYYKNININTFEYVESETGEGVEPKYFVPKLPMALLVSAFGLSIAHKSTPANLNMREVCLMVIQYIKIKQQFPNDKNIRLRMLDKLSKYCIPDFPIRCLHRNKKQALESYANGEFKFTTISDGILELAPSKIVIKTLPFGVKPRDIYKVIGKMLVDKKPNFANKNIMTVDDFSAGDTDACVTIALKRHASPFDVMEQLKKIIKFTGKLTPAYLYLMPNSHLEYLDPISVLDTWYDARERSIKAELRAGQRKAGHDIRRLQALIKIGDKVIDAVRILRDSDSVDEACPKLAKRFGLSRAQALTIMDFKLGNIPKRSRSDLQQELDIVKQKLQELHNKFFNVPKQITADCEFFMKKYPGYCDRNLSVIKFMGYIQVLNGVIQYETQEELFILLGSFSRVPVTIHRYPEGHRRHYLMSGSTMVETEDKLILPKEAPGCRIVASKNKPKYTIGINTREGTIFRNNNIQFSNDPQLQLEYISDSCVTVDKSGNVISVDLKDIPIRGSVKTRGVNSSILKVANCVGNVVRVVYSNANNTIVIETAAVGTKLRFPPMSIAKTTILGIYDIDTPFTISIPDNCLNKCNMRHLIVNNPNVFKEDKTIIKLNSKRHEYLSMERHHALKTMLI